MRVITRRATMLAGDRSQGVIEAHILFYVSSVRIRVFMRTLESNLVF